MQAISRSFCCFFLSYFCSLSLTLSYTHALCLFLFSCIVYSFLCVPWHAQMSLSLSLLHNCRFVQHRLFFSFVFFLEYSFTPVFRLIAHSHRNLQTTELWSSFTHLSRQKQIYFVLMIQIWFTVVAGDWPDDDINFTDQFSEPYLLTYRDQSKITMNCCINREKKHWNLVI